MQRLLRRFELERAGSTARREILAGGVTFATLSYVLFVQPAVLGAAGMDPGGVLFATCVASAVACFTMAWLANLPIALAPAMGHNFFFAFTVCGAMGLPWQQALAANLLSGGLFLALSPTGLRERVMEAVPVPLRAGIAAGIGLLIALLGLQWGGFVVDHPTTLVQVGDLRSPVPLATLAGLALTGVFLARRVPGAIGAGMVATGALAWAASRGLDLDLDPALVAPVGELGAIPSPRGTAFQLDFAGLFARPAAQWLSIVAVFLFLDLFDTVGSLLGLGRQAGWLDARGRLPGARGAFAADATGTVLGATLGTSTVTTYVESAAGIASGGRTGLAAVTVGVLFLLSLFLAPLVQVFGAGVPVALGPGGEVVTCYPVLAPALIVVGSSMMGALADVDWRDPVEALPAFLTALVIPFGFSIAHGIAWGFVASSALALASRRRVSAVVHVVAAVVLLWVFAT